MRWRREVEEVEVWEGASSSSTVELAVVVHTVEYILPEPLGRAELHHLVREKLKLV